MASFHAALTAPPPAFQAPSVSCNRRRLALPSNRRGGGGGHKQGVLAVQHRPLRKV